jgi:hypothetical protein
MKTKWIKDVLVSTSVCGACYMIPYFSAMAIRIWTEGEVAPLALLMFWGGMAYSGYLTRRERKVVANKIKDIFGKLN